MLLSSEKGTVWDLKLTWTATFSDSVEYFVR